MQTLTLSEIELAVGGVRTAGDPGVAIKNISTDTRTLALGDFYVPLVGRRLDGHTFLADALRAGACGCLISAAWPDKRQFLSNLPPGFGVLEVSDTNLAYGKIARYCRDLLRNLSVIAVTGSNGKSTTKEMIAAVLGTRFRVLKNEGTLNNLVGVPQTLLKLEADTQVAVLELGTSLPGEIASLCAIARPDTGVLTNVGPSHLEYFGTLDAIAQEKGMLAEVLSEKGLFVVGADDPRTWAIRSRTKACVMGFGMGEDADVRIHDAVCDAVGRWSFVVSLPATGQGERIVLKMLGKHNMFNAAAAVAVGIRYGVGLSAIKKALEACEGLKMRGETTSIGGYRVVNDAYNANPQSFARALETLLDIQTAGKKIVVLGDMLELGSMERQAHEDAGAALAHAPVALLITVGVRAAWAADAFVRSGRQAHEAVRFDNPSSAGEYAAGIARPGDAILLKGSRGMKLELVLNELQDAARAGEQRPRVPAQVR